MKKFMAFTLAEVIISLTLLGVIAAIVVPSTIKNSVNKAKQTKIKKAMVTYNNALEQYYINDYTDYYNQNKDITKSKKAALASYPISGIGITTAQRKENIAKRKEINAQYSAQLNNLKQKYTSKFASYYKVNRTAVSGDVTYYKMNDGLWWYFGSDPAMLSVIVAFDIKNPTTNETYTLTELQNLAYSKENKAFYLVAEKRSYATTPSIAPTYNLDMDNVDLFDFSDQSTSNMMHILQMQKLYNFINNNFNYKRIADTVCSGSSCCDNTKGSCISFYSTMFGSGDYWGIDDEVKEYQDGEVLTYRSYDSEHGVIGEIDYKNKTFSLDALGRDKVCFKYEDWGGTCSTVTKMYWDSYITNGTLYDPMLHCKTTKITCP